MKTIPDFAPSRSFTLATGWVQTQPTDGDSDCPHAPDDGYACRSFAQESHLIQILNLRHLLVCGRIIASTRGRLLWRGQEL
jgi:hypothetical protein